MNDNTRMIEVSATGHYSNASETHTCWVTKEFCDKYADAIGTFSYHFHELDGKHSETEGDVYIHESVTDMMNAWIASNGDHWVITEVLFDHIRGEADADEDDFIAMASLNEDMNETIEVRTETIVTFEGERFVI